MADTQIPRDYTGADADMLTAISTIVQNAIANKTFLISKRATWADPFFDDLLKEIDKVISTHLGVDSAKELRTATNVLTSIQTPALRDLAELKVQIEEDFKKEKPRRDEILTVLGYTTYDKKSKAKDQEALVAQLYQYKTNMTPALKTELTAKGESGTLISTISGYSQTLKDANISQEGYKGDRREVTGAAITAFNEVYNKVMSVARISAKFFIEDKNKQALFSYSKVLKTLNNKPGKPGAPPTS